MRGIRLNSKRHGAVPGAYNGGMPGPIPPALRGQRYLSLTSYRKDGTAVRTPLWFAEGGDALYVMTRSDSWKYKRIRNRPQVEVAPCTMRGTVTGPDFPALAAVLPESAWPEARRLLAGKYWLMKIPFLWSGKNVFVEIRFEPPT